MDLEARNSEPLVAESATEALVSALRELKVFTVISRAEMQQMLSIDRERALHAGGCADSSCLAEVGAALGARYLVVGAVTALDKAKGPYALRVQLFDMKRGEVAGEETRADLKAPRDVIEMARTLGQAVVRPILDKEQGFLELASKEEGANVSVDGRLIGDTPLPVLKLGWGPHRVIVEKEGFIAWGRDVQIDRNQVSAEAVTLIPSPEFIDSYRSRNRAMRVGAWVTTALAVVGAGAAAYLQLGPVDERYRDFEPLQKAFESQSANEISLACKAAGEDVGGQEGDEIRNDLNGACYQHAEELSKQGSNLVWAARGAAGAAVVAAAAATYFWTAGDDPGRYDLFIGGPTASETPSASIAPINGGVAASLSFGF
jgi:TolB-like protein